MCATSWASWASGWISPSGCWRRAGSRRCRKAGARGHESSGSGRGVHVFRRHVLGAAADRVGRGEADRRGGSAPPPPGGGAAGEFFPAAGNGGRRGGNGGGRGA